MVGEANNGATALELARHLRPDLVIADIFMPELEGTALARTLKEELPKLCVILVSAYSESAYEEVARGTGAIAYIPKIELTVEVLEQILRQECKLS